MMRRSLRAPAAGVVLLALAISAISLVDCGGDDNTSTTMTAKSATSLATTKAASTSPANTNASTAPSTSPSAAATAEIKMLPGQKYDKSQFSIPGNKNVTVTVDNTESGVQHSFAVYKSKADAGGGGTPMASAPICKGPCTETVLINLPAADYYYQCQVHPTLMNGTLSVQ